MNFLSKFTLSLTVFFCTIFYQFAIPLHAQKKYTTLFGHQLNSPIGIAACPATETYDKIAHAAQQGYDVIVHKTIRSHACPGLPAPNLCWIDSPQQCTYDDMGKTYRAHPCTKENTNYGLANSFGINCASPDTIKDDIAQSLKILNEGQVLIVSIYGSGESKELLIADFVNTAQLAYQAGARILEANLSCPNTGSDTMIYQDAELVHDICRAITIALPDVTLTIKIGMCSDQEQLAEIIKAAYAGGARGICGINTIPICAVDEFGNSVFGPDRTMSGLSGKPIQNATLQFIKQARTIIDQEKLEMTLFAVGGITQASDFDIYLAAGADIVLSATAAMHNPELARDYHDMHHYKGDKKIRELISKLYTCGALQTGSFKLKSGLVSPLYCDMRVTMSCPEILTTIARLMHQQLQDYPCDVVCGVPYGALPLTTALSLIGNHPMIMLRKEVKPYGMQKLIEGSCKTGNRCAIIEDVMTTGSSIMETVHALRTEGLIVTDAFVVIDREHGGSKTLHQHGCMVHALCTLTDVINILLEQGILTHKQYATVKSAAIQH